MENDEILLDVEGLKQYFPITHKKVLKAVDDISFKIRKGETFGLVGESGSGKTTIGRAIIRLYEPTGGRIIFDKIDITHELTKKNKTILRTNMQMIFQDPMSSLNPRKKIGDIIKLGLDVHAKEMDEKTKKNEVYHVLKQVGLDGSFVDRYPKELSGGQRQRVGIARAIIMHPKLIIADEPLSALDVSVQAQVVNLLKQIQKETGIAILFIAHDLSMVRYISDRIAVVHLGHLLEMGTTDEVFKHPMHPYTKSLISAIPGINPRLEKKRHRLNYQKNVTAYLQRTTINVGGTHVVLGHENEIEAWQENDSLNE